MQRSIAIAISGGVDSSAAAVLLRRRFPGAKLLGVHMSNWNRSVEDKECQGDLDAELAERVCQQLHIPFHHVSFEQEYWTTVFSDFVDQLAAGFTPNPDTICNVKIKFSRLLRYCRDELGADTIATGHFARLSPQQHLLRGAFQDQSYFLGMVPAFPSVDFPIGHLSKEDVRSIAADACLPTAERKSSVGLCFVGKRSFPSFIDQFMTARPGGFIDVNGQPILGHVHRGQHLLTIGQRARMPGMQQAMFVSGKQGDAIQVVDGRSHPALFAISMIVSCINWIGAIEEDDLANCTVVVRYRASPGRCRLREMPDGRYAVQLLDLHRGVTPGQTAVFYHGDRCLGGGYIDQAGPTLHDLGLQWSNDVFQGDVIPHESRLLDSHVSSITRAQEQIMLS